MTSFNDVTIICSTILVGKPLHMHRRTAMVCLHTCQHPHQITIYYESLESHHLFSKTIFVPVTHVKINLPVFKDEDAKDAITSQSWKWDLTVYCHEGCRNCTLLQYAIQTLQSYPGELDQSSGTDITLDNVLTIIDEHYNNIKALDTLNQELF